MYQEETRSNDCKQLGIHMNKSLLEMIATNKKLKESLVQLKNTNNLLSTNSENLEISLNHERKRKDQMRNFLIFRIIICY